MPRSSTLSAAVAAAAALVACGSLDSSTDSLPALATVQGSLVNPDMLSVTGAVRVAVVWRTMNPGQFRVAQDLPVQPVFPAAFKIALDGPPPAEAMLVEGAADAPPPTGPDAGMAFLGPNATSDAGGGTGGVMMQSLHTLGVPGNSAPLEVAIGTVVAYADTNGNGKLDLLADDAGAYIDQVIATNVETSILYIQGPIPSDLKLDGGAAPVEGYNLFDQPPCNDSPAAQPETPGEVAGFGPNAACTQPAAGPDAGAPVEAGPCLPPEWLPISTPFALKVATAPEISQVACLNGGSNAQPGFSSAGGTIPPDPSVQPATYPDPCDPNLACTADGSQYFYLTCATVVQGLCLPSYTNCTSVGYSRPTPAPAAWPCIH